MDRVLTPPIWASSHEAAADTGPARKPLRAPVFIHDAATPWGSETLLLKLWRDQNADQDE
ncbi:MULTISPECIES: hypothetical protein [unclassified Ruegeria]|uniref:hypothetical protein n=1 Tax=unclassified Ruegeria TaxID=2625375 RepID=UPI00148860B3|nr:MULTISPECIES: hypothetical protein [unclassified Ruegeria]